VISGKEETGDSNIFSEKPGIFNLWFIWESSRIPVKDKKAADLEYIAKKNLIYDLLLIFKSIPASFYYQDSREFKHSIHLLGIDFLNIDMTEAIDIIDNSVSKKEKSSFFFVNPDCFNKTFKDEAYLKVLKGADYIFPDGIGITIACKMIKNPLKENINGTDMFPLLCERAVKKDYSIYLLGAEPGIAEIVKENTEKKYPGIRIVGFRDGYFDHDQETGPIISRINKLQPDILLVAFGAPAQEKWISRHKAKIQAYAILGVGGLFDFYSGKNKRAPRWMREIGLEWVYRITQEPGRMWKRYLFGNPLFLYRVRKWKKKKKREKSASDSFFY
jgi:N-acetylglucosaminyldiphosphoundecaprenol N-acetyl-beta-D-mannosaminyltransferase